MEKLFQIQDELTKEKKDLEVKLEKIQWELDTISETLKIMEKRKSKKDDRQTSLIPNEDLNEYAEMTFKNALLTLLEKNPEKKLVPKEITKTLLKKGFQTKSKNFGNIVRAMLQKFREDELVEAEKIQKGKMEMWQYWHKKQEVKPIIRRRKIEF